MNHAQARPKLLTAYIDQPQKSAEVKDLGRGSNWELSLLEALIVSSPQRANSLSTPPSVNGGGTRLAQQAVVRAWVLRVQCQAGREYNLVVEGRGIATVVFPQAQIRILLTAALEVRAQRIMLREKAEDFDGILPKLLARDRQDQERSASLLRPDARVYQRINTTHLSARQQTLAQLLAHVKPQIVNYV